MEGMKVNNGTNDQDGGGEIIIEGGELANVSANPKPSVDVGQKAAGLVRYDQIVAARIMPREELYVPDWDGFIVIQAFTRDQAEKLREDSMEVDDNGRRVPNQSKAEHLTFQRGIVQPHFTANEVAEIWRKSPAWLIEGILKQIAELNASAGKALEEAKKKAEYSFRA